MRFLGLGHMFKDVVENGQNRNKNSNCSNMIVLVLCCVRICFTVCG
jgi:hypothetical protein